MTRLRLHLTCAGWAVGAAVCALAVSVSYAQGVDPAPVAPAMDPTSDLLLRLASTVGLPGVVAWVAWQLRGLLAGGITVRLSDEDRDLLRRAGPPKGE